LKNKHGYLAKQQGTKFAVDSTQEKVLFKKLMQEDSNFTGINSLPEWKKAVTIWNQKADGKEAFYKVSSITKFIQLMDFEMNNFQLPEHLQAYYNKWLCNVNEKKSISQALTKVKALQQKHCNPERANESTCKACQALVLSNLLGLI
jgi:hypothetical protein